MTRVRDRLIGVVVVLPTNLLHAASALHAHLSQCLRIVVFSSRGVYLWNEDRVLQAVLLFRRCLYNAHALTPIFDARWCLERSLIG